MDFYSEKTDRRVIRTKKAIYLAAVKLMSEKDINSITVKSIAELADINRKTFYNYYYDIYSLVDEIENNIVENLALLIRNADLRQIIAEPSAFISKLHEMAGVHIDLLEAIFSSKGNSELIRKIINRMIEITEDAAVEQFGSDPERTAVIVRFIFSGEIAVYEAWFHSGRKMPVDELSGIVERLLQSGLSGLTYTSIER